METTGPSASSDALPPTAPTRRGPFAWVAEPLRSVWVRRQLFRRVQRRDIESTFRGSILGLLWIILIPLAMVAVYSFVFGVVMQSAWTTGEVKQGNVPLIYFCGILIFGFFFEVLNRAPNHIRNHASYVKKVIFPLDLLGWTLVGTAGIKVVIGFGLLFAFLCFAEGRLVAEILWIPVLFAPYAVLMVGFSWILCAIGTYVRDLGHVIAAVAPVIMFVSPVFYSLQQVPEAFRGFYLANPLTFVLEHSRMMLFFGGSLPWDQYAVYWLAALAVFYLGYLFFERARPGFADVV
jgi:lipopolysaccharide transport system permease protein